LWIYVLCFGNLVDDDDCDDEDDGDDGGDAAAGDNNNATVQLYTVLNSEL
jgi:hypothetical protein